MKQKRFHLSDIVIPAIVAGLVALLLSRWEAVPRRGADGLLDNAHLWPREDEETLGRTLPEEIWLDRATRLADTYGILGRHDDEEELLEKCLTVSESLDRAFYARLRRPDAGDTQRTEPLVSALSQIYTRSGRPVEALPMQQRELRNMTKHYSNDSGRASLLAEIAASQRALGLDKEALTSLHLALKIKFPNPSRSGAPDTPGRQWLQEYKEVLIKTGKTPEEADGIIGREFGQ